IKGVMLGDRSDISDEVRAAFQKTGTIHVLAISGLHIGLIALVLNLFLQRLKISQVGKWVAFGIYTIALVYYSNITGNSPPVKRAVIMAILFELGRVLERKSSSLNTLAAASVIMLALNPRELFSVSFHLTNAAVASILLIYPKISGLYAPEKERWWEQVTKYAWDALALTVAASIGTAPFVSHYFGSVPLLGLLANLFVTDMMSLALFASMLSLFFDLLGSGFGEYYAISAYYLVRGAIAMAEFFSRVPLSNLELKISTSETILFFLIVATVMQRKEPRKCAWLLIGTLLFATGLVVSTLLKEKDEPVLIFNAIGRGSSVIFKTASETVLIDAGVSERQWKRVQKQLQVFRCDTLDAFLQASSPPSIVATVPATQKMLWKDHTLRLQTLVAYRPERALLKVVSKKCRFLVALNPLSLKCSDFFKVPVAMVRLKKFGLREAKALRDWINYAQPRLVSVDLSAMKNPFARKQFYRFAKSMQQIKTTERDGQILFTLP
ncbi:MAG: ComEC/Rec2 family competence protein, partial [Chloroherpetonaceae bacterium]|nr:ComEC/Rec2 family competence protein [Chloroherpetonaceae bacterium]